MKVIATIDKMLSETETEFTYKDGIQVRFINSIPIHEGLDGGIWNSLISKN